jgi:ATP-dependent Clp protease ATP-binding subunit ClpA
MNDMFEKFTERSRKALSLAQNEAQRLNHNYIGTEHILLGLVAEGEGVAAKALQHLGVELPAVRRQVEFIVGRGDRPLYGEIGMTPRGKKVLQLAVDEARRMNHHYIGTEHLLLGMIREGEGIAAGVLESLGISLEQARNEVLRIIGQPGAPADAQADAVAATPESPAAPKNNVVTCRLDDAAVNALDALVEAGIRSTRSDAAAWLISAGIEAHRELFDRVNTTVSEIRKLRQEARDIAHQVANGTAENRAPEDNDNEQSNDDDKDAGETDESGEIKDPEEPEDLDDLGRLDEPPDKPDNG